MCVQFSVDDLLLFIFFFFFFAGVASIFVGFNLKDITEFRFG